MPWGRRADQDSNPYAWDTWALGVTVTLRIRHGSVIEMTFTPNPMWDWTGYIARNTDGTGVVRIDMRQGNASHFKLDKLPSPQDHGVQLPGSERRVFNFPARRRGANCLSYRIAYQTFEGSSKPHMCRFRLSSNACNDTLQVLTNHLNESGVDWLYLCNEHGNRISRSAFHSK